MLPKDKSWMFDPSLSDDEFEKKLNEHLKKLEKKDLKAEEDQKKIEKLIDNGDLYNINEDLLKFANDLAAKYVGKKVDDDVTKNITDDIIEQLDTIDKKLNVLEKDIKAFDKNSSDFFNDCNNMDKSFNNMLKEKSGIFEKNHLSKFSKINNIPFLGGRPKRDLSIDKNDILDLKIALETSESLDEFLINT
jgi:flagellar hook-basal body complex protein FliE